MRRMTWAIGAVLALGAALGAAGCGGDDGGAGGSGATGGGAAGGAGGGTGGGSANSGDCETSADCGGEACVEVTPGGYRVCQVTYPEATSCDDPADTCCDTSECASGACFETPIVPFCGGVQPQVMNVCVADQCDSDDVCGPNTICTPAGTLDRKVRACATAMCKVDSDCGAEAGGVCAPVTDPCCGFAAGLYCVYPSDGCRSNQDCPGGYCELTAEGRTRCATGGPLCPA